MSACGGHFECPLDVLLSLYVGEVEGKLVLMGKEFLAGVDDGGLHRGGLVEEVYDLGDVVRAVDGEVVDDSCLACVLLGYYHAFEAQLACLDGDGQCAFDGLQAAVEAQLAHEQEARQAFGLDEPVGSQQADGQGQVVGRAFLADVGGGHVDDGLTGRQFVAVDCKGGGDALLALFDGRVGQTDEVEEAAFGGVYFDGD